ncbi:MAG: DUF805 domain-containing protein [Turicibacter sp.]|nr:DUF805 domain-containing protein [Turicibacter sp.]
MKFTEAYRSFWRNYFNFMGNASRREYWYFIVWNLIISVILGFGLTLSCIALAVSAFNFGQGFTAAIVFAFLFGGLLSLYWIATFIPMISLSVRRYHDTGLSGWWFIGFYLISFVLSVGTSGLLWNVISCLISIVSVVITVLPTNYFVKNKGQE